MSSRAHVRRSRDIDVTPDRHPPAGSRNTVAGQGNQGPNPPDLFGGKMPSITHFVRLFVALALAMISVPLLLAAPANAVPAGHVVICKYVSTPGPNEVASHVIMSSVESLAGSFDPNANPLFPQSFSDAQGFSIAIRYTVDGESPNDTSILDECPVLNPTDECDELPGDQPPDFQCEPEVVEETRDLGPLLDCDAGTITTLHQMRTKTQTFNAETQTWEEGEFTPWETVDTTVEDATAEDCPVDNPPEPIVDPPVDNPPGENPTLPNTGSSPYLTALALMGGLILTAGSALFMRGRKVRVPKA